MAFASRRVGAAEIEMGFDYSSSAKEDIKMVLPVRIKED